MYFCYRSAAKSSLRDFNQANTWSKMSADNNLVSKICVQVSQNVFCGTERVNHLSYQQCLLLCLAHSLPQFLHKPSLWNQMTASLAINAKPLLSTFCERDTLPSMISFNSLNYPRRGHRFTVKETEAQKFCWWTHHWRGDRKIGPEAAVMHENSNLTCSPLSVFHFMKNFIYTYIFQSYGLWFRISGIPFSLNN